METSKMKYVFPVGLFLAFLLDGTLSSILASQMFTSHVAIESRLILLWFVMAIFTVMKKSCISTFGLFFQACF